MDCNDEENNHADIKLAKDVELAHVKAGNFNYAGVGWPGKENRVLIDSSTGYYSLLPVLEED